MQTLMSILAGCTSLYMLLIFIRILLTWFSGANYGRPMELLCRITDPYLDWFRRFSALRVGFLDLSPIVAMAVLSVANHIFTTLARFGIIHIGGILAMVAASLWSAVSFILGFFIVVLVLRLFAYLTSQNIYGSFWRIIDTISQPVLYRINRLFFRRRLVHYQIGIFLSIGVLLGLIIGGGFLIRAAVSLLERLPL
jgi:YggT family protein